MNTILPEVIIDPVIDDNKYYIRQHRQVDVFKMPSVNCDIASSQFHIRVDAHIKPIVDIYIGIFDNIHGMRTVNIAKGINLYEQDLGSISNLFAVHGIGIVFSLVNESNQYYWNTTPPTIIPYKDIRVENTDQENAYGIYIVSNNTEPCILLYDDANSDYETNTSIKVVSHGPANYGANTVNLATGVYGCLSPYRVKATYIDTWRFNGWPENYPVPTVVRGGDGTYTQVLTIGVNGKFETIRIKSPPAGSPDPYSEALNRILLKSKYNAMYYVYTASLYNDNDALLVGLNCTDFSRLNKPPIGLKPLATRINSSPYSLEYEVNEITFVRTAVLPTELDIYTVLRGSFFNESLKLICNNKVVFEN